ERQKKIDSILSDSSSFLQTFTAEVFNSYRIAEVAESEMAKKVEAESDPLSRLKNPLIQGKYSAKSISKIIHNDSVFTRPNDILNCFYSQFQK
ncbi:Hypothetical protein FKW44_006203, partial [Caligus rogercresseyi]